MHTTAYMPEQMSNSAPLTLQNIQDYAKRYFPGEFATLPPIEWLQWQSASSYRTKSQLSLMIAPLKLSIGHSGRDSRNKVWAHQSLDRVHKVYQLSGLDRKLTIACPSSHVDLYHPFRAAFREHNFGSLEGGERRGCELRTLIQYYFMLKGAIPEVEPFWALGSFEWAVRSVAYGAPLNNVSVDQFGHAAAERLLSIRSMIPHEQQTPATTPNAVTLQIQGLLPNEEQTCTVEDHRTNGIGGMGMKIHGTRHTDRMKKLFKGQSDARKKADQYLALTSADKKAHVARIRQLEIQLSEEQVARVDADRGITALSERNRHLQKRLDEANVAFAEANKKLEIEITDARLQRQRVRAEQNRRIEAENKLKEECARTEARWQKARAFYTNQQELLEMQVADCTDEEKEAILREFQEDYGELGLK